LIHSAKGHHLGFREWTNGFPLAKKLGRPLKYTMF